MRSSVIAFCLVCVASITSAANPAVSNVRESSRSFLGENYVHGWRFIANTPITVTHLGVFDDFGNGLQGDYPVALYRDSDQSLIAFGNVASQTANPLIGLFRYVDTTDVTLVPGSSYSVCLFARRFFHHDSADVATSENVVTPAITLQGRAYKGGVSDMVYPSMSGESFLYGPNFLFVPEPSTSTLAILAIPLVVHRTRRISSHVRRLS